MATSNATLATLAEVKAMLAVEPSRKPTSMASALGLSRSRVANLARVLDLPEPVLSWVWAGRLSAKHGEALATAPAAVVETLAREAIAASWSTERLRLAVAVAKGKRKAGEPNPNADMQALEQALSELVSAPVRIAHRKDGTGELVLGYTSLDTLDGLLDRLGYKSEW